MAYRFDGGRGAVTCNKCNIIFDGRISYQEYLEAYGEGPDYCWKHKDLRPVSLKLSFVSQEDKGVIFL